MSKFHLLHWDQTLTLDGSGLPWIMLKVWLELWVQWTEGLGESYKLCNNQNNKLIISAHHDVFDWKMAQLNRLFIIIQYAFKYVFVEL